MDTSENQPGVQSPDLAAAQAQIAALEQALAEAKAREERYRLLSDAALEGILIHERGIILDANAALGAMFGYAVHDLIGQDALILAAPDTRPLVAQKIAANFAGAYTGTGLRSDGSTFPIEINGRPILYRGRAARLAVIRDLTEVLAAQEALRRTQERYRMLAEHVRDVIWTMDASGRFTYVSPSVEYLRGYTAEEVMQQSLDQVLTPASLAQVEDYLQALRAGSNDPDLLDPDRRYVLEQPCKDGSTIWTETKVNLIRNVDGRPIGVLGVSRDITERRRFEAALAQERTLLRTLIDNLPDSVFVKDLQGRFLLNNAESLRRMGVSSQEETLGKVTADFFPEKAAEWDALEQQVIRTGRKLVHEEGVIRSDGDEHWIRSTQFPLYDQQGTMIGLAFINQDLTEQKAAERQQYELEMERERTAVLERFIGDASHSFKTPLTTMRVSLGVLRRTDDPAKVAEHLNILSLQVDYLERTLDDLLNLIQLDRDLTLELERLDARDLIDAAVRSGQTMALGKGHTLEWQRPDMGFPVFGDFSRLKRTLDVILLNAVNYTPYGGTITFGVKSEGRQVCITVADTGIGIPDTDLPYIFNRFYRVDPARDVSTGGMGVGLTIARKIVEAHRGWIKVESVPGQGTTFKIYLPVAQ
ncbi:MAG: PAS domain S-box protein [Anaerolineae bacterium]|nr:PAS domain S-box protein [Anaerolineae bacterium]